MAFKKFTKIVTKDADLNRVQDNIFTSLDPVVSKIQLDSNVIQNVILTNLTTVNVPHLLNRIPIGFIVINKTNESDVWNAKISDANYLYLTCSSNCTITILTF